jgi:hypothetical protein
MEKTHDSGLLYIKKQCMACNNGCLGTCYTFLRYVAQQARETATFNRALTSIFMSWSRDSEPVLPVAKMLKVTMGQCGTVALLLYLH